MKIKSLNEVCHNQSSLEQSILASDKLVLKAVKCNEEEVLITILSKDKFMEVFNAVGIIIGTDYSLKLIEE